MGRDVGSGSSHVYSWVLGSRTILLHDIHAIRHRMVMSASAVARVLVKYAAGVLALACSAAGLWLRLTEVIPPTAGVLDHAKLSLLAWVAVFSTCGWIGTSSREEGRSHDSRMLARVMAVLMAPASLMLTFAAITIPLIEGDPRTFRTIGESRGRDEALLVLTNGRAGRRGHAGERLHSSCPHRRPATAFGLLFLAAEPFLVAESLFASGLARPTVGDYFPARD
jgi:hypothetical protein